MQDLASLSTEQLQTIGRDLAVVVDEKLDTRIATLKAEVTRLVNERTAKSPVGFGPAAPAPATETPGARFVASPEFRSWMSGPGQRGRCILAAPFVKAALTNVQVQPAARLPEINAWPTAPPATLQLVNWRPISGANSVDFLRESAAPTPGAASQAGEGAAKAEQTITVTLITAAIETVACWTPISIQALNDTSQLQRFVDAVLTQLVLAELDRQLLNGTGAAAHQLDGVVTGASTYDTGLTLAGDGSLDIISHAQAQLFGVGVTPNAVVLSPTAAERVKLAKDDNGGYLWGAPAAGAPASVWGLVPVVDPNLSTVDFLVGDFTARSVEFLVREEVVVEVSREHSDYFVRNLAAVRAEARGANGLYRPSAFVKGDFPAPALAAKTSAPKKG